MIVGDQHIIYRIREINIRKMLHIGMIAVIADHGSTQNADLLCFDKDAGMTEIPHPYLVACVSAVYGRGGCFSEKVSGKALPVRGDTQQFLIYSRVCGVLFILASSSIPGDQRIMADAALRFLQSWGAQAKRPVVVLGDPYRDTLGITHKTRFYITVI